MRTTVIIGTLVAVLGAAQAPPRFALRGGCVLPFASIAPTRDVFEFCDNAGRREGVPVPALADRLRLDAQNNFCAPAADPLRLELAEFGRLPDAAPESLLTSRRGLARFGSLPGRGAFGEGTVVQVIGVIEKAHVTGCREPLPGEPPAELVSCHFLGGRKTSELQLNLRRVGTPGANNACDTVIAKITPHFRPVWWRDIDVQTPVPPVRITGQLFYDDTAVSCRVASSGVKTRQGEQARSSNWEIHPVYAIDVCVASSQQDCTFSNASAWLPYHKWIQEKAPPTHATGLAERVACDAASLKWLATQPQKPGEADP